MSEQASVRVIRSYPEIEGIRDAWVQWQHHPNSDVDFLLKVSQSRSNVLNPHIMVLSRDGRPDAMLIGRVIDGPFELRIGSLTFLRPKARMINFVQGGGLGNLSDENSRILVDSVLESLRGGEADAAVFRYLRKGSPIFAAALGMPRLGCRDNFPAVQVHRAMTVPL